MWQAFKFFDQNNSGTISKEDIVGVLQAAGMTFTEKELALILRDCGLYEKESLNFDNFKHLLNFL
jgi:Ca2+-binding EF-hand superfamily protein